MLPRRSSAAVLLLVGSLVLAATPTDAAGRVAAQLRFDRGTVGEPVVASVGGDRDLRARVVTSNGGRAMTVRSRAGHGKAVDFPSVSDSAAGRRAVIRVLDTDTSDGDALSPRRRNFVLRADFKLDAGDSQADGGNNLVQRGLAMSSDQYKIQVDLVGGRARPACSIGQTIRGVWRSAVVTVRRSVRPREWYQVRCRRTAHALTLTVAKVDRDGSLRTVARRRVSGIRTFDLRWPASSRVPLTVGGKLRPDGGFASSSDQFNGVVDNVMLRLG